MQHVQQQNQVNIVNKSILRCTCLLWMGDFIWEIPFNVHNSYPGRKEEEKSRDEGEGEPVADKLGTISVLLQLVAFWRQQLWKDILLRWQWCFLPACSGLSSVQWFLWLPSVTWTLGSWGSTLNLARTFTQWVIQLEDICDYALNIIFWN